MGFPKPWKAEYAKSGRSKCETCKNTIGKEKFRLGKMVQATQFDGFMPVWNHAGCILKKEKQIKSIDDVEGIELLRWEDQLKIRKYVEGGGNTQNDPAPAVLECGVEVSQTDRGAKRKGSAKSDPKSKFAKTEGNEFSRKNANMVANEKASDLEDQLEAQTKKLWALKDDLKRHVTTVELREMLEANDQDSTGSELDLRDRCSDGMLFGGLGKCPRCSGFLRCSGGMYRCHGNLSKWSTCPYSTTEPVRVKGKWKIPEESSNEYVCKWYKSQNAKKPVRILPPPSSTAQSGSVDANGLSQQSKTNSENIGDLKGAIPAMGTVKVKGRSSVHEDSGLQDSCHILEVGKSIYNATLNKCDLSTDVNSYYILQIIEKDKGSDCYVFRKWGRIGDEKIGGSKCEEMSKSKAIQKFKHLFLMKTKNSWEAWEQKKKFQKQPGRFFLLDIDYGLADAKSQLAPSLVELMKMLFNVETYRAAMREFEINMSEMPLGKLSKINIQKGFEALTEIQNLLKSNVHNPSFKDSLIVDASNRFFTVIPSIQPHVIRDEDDLKSKVKMLEALQDIEISSRLVGFDDDNDESLDEKYKKLHCDIAPLPHNSEDFLLIEKYLQNTHAPTHTYWDLELEEVFALEREGEFDEFAPYREKLKNRMLLWHGSRLTNFVGILNQGLRIAPPEAPASGYMFGKGIYFADLVSKSAQYCCTDKKNPVGLMLLSEVALGEVYELKQAKYMDKPPKGKHSTKGLGKKIPKESEYVKWRDEVVVPCGKPVASNVKASKLKYNEYIVYNTAQVKLQFLLKVRFHHKT